MSQLAKLPGNGFSAELCVLSGMPAGLTALLPCEHQPPQGVGVATTGGNQGRVMSLAEVDIYLAFFENLP